MRTEKESWKSSRLAAGAVAIMMAIATFSKGAESSPSVPVIERESVQSTNIASIGYSRLDEVLEIEFKTGEIYRYEKVPAGVFAELRSAPSKGRYFAQYIRSRFKFTRARGRSL